MLQTTVMPFIIRGVSLLGVASAGTARAIRDEIWARLSGDWKPMHLDRNTRFSAGIRHDQRICRIGDRIILGLHQEDWRTAGADMRLDRPLRAGFRIRMTADH